MKGTRLTFLSLCCVLACCTAPGDNAPPSESSSLTDGAASPAFPLGDASALDAGSSIPVGDTATPSQDLGQADSVGCYPECFAKACGDDGCGGTCGVCLPGTQCVQGLCEGEPDCIPDCVGKACGADGCDGTCGSCGVDLACESGQCVPMSTCTPDCAGKSCGDDGCGGSCGGCSAPSICQNGQCICTPQCADKDCGDDGCGGSCGACASPDTCVDGACVCAPACDGTGCAADGCGGTCAPCGCADQRVYVRAATLGDPGLMQVFFTTQASTNWEEGKSKWSMFHTGGNYETIELLVGDHAEWKGTITGLRIDPLTSNEPFGIDHVCLGYGPDDCLLEWTFDGASEVTSPFFDWTLIGIEETWTDGLRWGGQGKANDPRFRTEFELECEP